MQGKKVGGIYRCHKAKTHKHSIRGGEACLGKKKRGKSQGGTAGKEERTA